MEYSNDEII